MKRTLVVAAMLVASYALPSRNMTSPKINPGCVEEPGGCSSPWVVVTAGIGSNSTIQHLWGTRGALSFLVVSDVGGPEINIDWMAFRSNLPRSITFPQQPPSNIFGLLIPNLILYNDFSDSGAFHGQNASLRVPVSSFTWDAHALEGSQDEAAVLLETTHYQDTPLPNNTRLHMQVAAYGRDGRSTVLPHLLRTPDSAQLDLILDNFNLNLTQESEWKQARWGMDVVVFSSEHPEVDGGEDSGIKYHTQKSLDDEHTPGVFNLDQITTAGARTDGKTGGYLQWRPISYLSSEREIGESTTPNLNTTLTPLTNLTDSLKASLAYAVLGEDLLLPDAAITSVVSFGQPKDGFYQAANYTTWTVAVGEGLPPRETFSTLVVVVISLGVSIPVVMFLAGCVVLGYRRCRRTSSLALLHQDEE